MTYTKGEDIQSFLTALHYKCEELAAISVQITQREYQYTILKSLSNKLAKFVAQLLISTCYSGFILNTDTLINSVIKELRHLKN